MEAIPTNSIIKSIFYYLCNAVPFWYKYKHYMANSSAPKITLESSLKALEIENFLDKYFYRPIGFFIALALRKTSVTPNMVTVLSIFVGVYGGTRFYYSDLENNIIGVVMLILANTLDCVDGQLARLTGIKSKVGRILDGFAGDLWFVAIYFSIAARLVNEGWSPWIYAAAILSGYSHSRQAAMADYFKNFHLFMLKGDAGSELHDSIEMTNRYRKMNWKRDFVEKLFQCFYIEYTKGQESLAPSLIVLKKRINSTFTAGIPSRLVNDFRANSSRQWMHILSFNGRAPMLFIVVLFNHPWIYYAFEIIVLNVVMFLGLRSYSNMSKTLTKLLDKGEYEQK